MFGVYRHLFFIFIGYFASLFFPKPVLDKNLFYQKWKANDNK
jgi:SSS family solute:Na+ symporter